MISEENKKEERIHFFEKNAARISGIMLQKDIIASQNDRDETEKQLKYIGMAGQYVSELRNKLGRVPRGCVTNFGCQMNVDVRMLQTA